MSEWVSGAEILEQLHITAPAAEDVTWSDLCAGAVSRGIDHRLADALMVNPPPAELYAELRFAAVTAGVEAYSRRQAVFGLTGYVDMQGAAVRVARDYLDSIAPIVARYATIGIA